MPILDNIMDHDLLGPVFRQGEMKGEQKGELRGELKLLRRSINKRFGLMPAWVDDHLANLSSPEIEALNDRLFEVQTLEELIPR